MLDVAAAGGSMSNLSPEPAKVARTCVMSGLAGDGVVRHGDLAASDGSNLTPLLQTRRKACTSAPDSRRAPPPPIAALTLLHAHSLPAPNRPPLAHPRLPSLDVMQLVTTKTATATATATTRP
jgi:hypothetical protein